jgi:hypothetical protein
MVVVMPCVVVAARAGEERGGRERDGDGGGSDGPDHERETPL